MGHGERRAIWHYVSSYILGPPRTVQLLVPRPHLAPNCYPQRDVVFMVQLQLKPLYSTLPLRFRYRDNRLNWTLIQHSRKLFRAWQKSFFSKLNSWKHPEMNWWECLAYAQKLLSSFTGQFPEIFRAKPHSNNMTPWRTKLFIGGAE